MDRAAEESVSVVRKVRFMSTVAASVLREPISELRQKRLDVYTFALYFDHESKAISICADTASNSAATVRGINTYNRKYFDPAVAAGDLKAASLWCSSIGRSLSLGDFVARNLARTPVKGSIIGNEFFVGMLRALMDAESGIATPGVDRIGQQRAACSRTRRRDRWP
jgi:hypothetical protein